MGTFGGMARMRTGYWAGIRKWLLYQAADISWRLKLIESEKALIGNIIVHYKKHPGIDGGTRCSEHRTGFQVTQSSSLEMLIASYISMGGNPMDISMFLRPDSTVVESAMDGQPPVLHEQYPYGGVAAPLSAQGPEETEARRQGEDLPDNYSGGTFGNYPGGGLNLKKYQATRLGQGRLIWTNTHTYISAAVNNLRGWANQEIAEKLHLIEHKIIKLCDLREQLINEKRFVLGTAWAGCHPALDSMYHNVTATGNAEGLTGIDEDGSAFAKTFNVAMLVADFDQVFYHPSVASDTESPFFNRLVPKTDANLGNSEWAYVDLSTGEEAFLDMML